MSVHADQDAAKTRRLPTADTLGGDWVADQLPDPDPDEAEDPKAGRPAQSTQLLTLAEGAYDLGQTASGDLYAVPKPGKGPYVARLLRGRGGSLRAELARRYAHAHGRAPSQQALADAMLVLQGRCQIAPRAELALRVAAHGPGVVLDLGDETGRAVVVTPDGWAVVDRSPVLFRRTELTAALPEPETGGSLELLRPLLNVDDTTWPLLVAWLLAALLQPGIPHPVVAPTGEQGSAKSLTTRLLARLLDPATPQLRQPPRDLETWTVAAAGSYLVALDNLTAISDWLSDAICRASTGDGLVKRALYTDDGLAVLAFRRCVLVNGIAFAELRGDLADRLLPVDCQRVEEERRRDEQELLDFFDQAWPAILGGLLDLAVEVLAVLPTVYLKRRPRMADFARVVAATDQVLGTSGLDTYLGLRLRAAEEQIEGDLVAGTVRRFTLDCRAWQGTAGELLAELTPDRPPKGWPATPRGLSARLTRAAPALRTVGLEVEYLGQQGHGRARTWFLAEKTRKQPSAPSATAQSQASPQVSGPPGADGSEPPTVRDRPQPSAPTVRNRPQPSAPPDSKPAGQGASADGADGVNGCLPYSSGENP